MTCKEWRLFRHSFLSEISPYTLGTAWDADCYIPVPVLRHSAFIYVCECVCDAPPIFIKVQKPVLEGAGRFEE